MPGHTIGDNSIGIISGLIGIVIILIGTIWRAVVIRIRESDERHALDLQKIVDRSLRLNAEHSQRIRATEIRGATAEVSIEGMRTDLGHLAHQMSDAMKTITDVGIKVERACIRVAKEKSKH